MSLNVHIMLGERIDLRLGKTEYKSMVQDIVDDHTMLVTYPLDTRGVPAPIDGDATLEVIYYRPNGQFFFDAKVIGRAKVNGLGLMRILVTGDSPRKLQRRNSFRFEYNTLVYMRLMDPPPDLKKVYPVYSRDISDSGMQISSPVLLPANTEVELNFALSTPDGDNLRIRATVRRQVDGEIPKNSQFFLGLEYKGISDSVRQKIVRFIMLEQVYRRGEKLGLF